MVKNTVPFLTVIFHTRSLKKVRCTSSPVERFFSQIWFTPLRVLKKTNRSSASHRPEVDEPILKYWLMVPIKIPSFPYTPRIRGSNASRRPLPNILNASISAETTSAGNSVKWGLLVSTFCPSASSTPIEGSGAWMPRPR